MNLSEKKCLRVGWVLELVVVLVGLAREMPEESVYLAVGQPAFALFGAGVEIGQAPADDERPDVVLILGQLEVEGGGIADLLASDELRAAGLPRFEGAVDRLCPLVSVLVGVRAPGQQSARGRGGVLLGVGIERSRLL